MKRVDSIDIVRGIVMIIMTLDHTRDLIHVDSLTQQPTDLSTASAGVFFTRWITHLCAPTFIFLSGASAFLSIKPEENTGDVRKRLVIRGLLLILLDFSVVNFGLWFDLDFGVLIFNVLAAIGSGFIVLAILIRRSAVTAGLTGIFMVLAYPLFIRIFSGETGVLSKSLTLLFNPGSFQFGDGRQFIMGYPPIPWLAVLFLGFSCGPLFGWAARRRKRVFVHLGNACISCFLIIRSLNSYGDPLPWSIQKNFFYTLLSFLNVTKYPPSLDFDLCMLGIMFLLLACAETVKNRLTEVSSVFGRAPLIYFLLHWYIIHPILLIILLVQGYSFTDMVFGTSFGRPKGETGLDLSSVYLIWLLVLIILYPVCNWSIKYKASKKKDNWLRYL